MIRRVVLPVLAAASVAGVVILLPPRSRELGAVPAASAPPIRGAFHIHTKRSDGSGTVDDVAAAAARAGLQFAIITDHGDASRAPDPPSYHSGVLCIDAVEISTENGHLVALGLPQAPYLLGGEGRDVVEDVVRLGGFGIVAHPTPSRGSVRWTEWTAPFGGIEWLNGDSEWRDEKPRQLTHAILAYPFRPAEALSLLLDRPDLALQRWDALTQRRRIVAVAAGDAHARLGLPDETDAVQRRVAIAIPGYTPVFKAFSIAIPNVRLTGRADEDARTVTENIRQGHVYSVVDSIAGPGAIDFRASSGRNTAQAGDALTPDGQVHLHVGVHGPPDTRVALIRNGQRLRQADATSLEHAVDTQRAVYRVEVYVPGSPGAPMVPWIVSNPIYVGFGPDNPRVPPRRAPTRTTSLDSALATWAVEHSTASQAAVNVVGAAGGAHQALFRYALAGTPSSFPFAALAVPAIPGLAQFDRLTFRIRSDRPIRVSVQLRRPGNGNGDRWHRSVFADETPRDVSVFFDDMTPRAGAPPGHPPLDAVDSILFVVDSVNTKVGASGQFAIENPRYER